MNKWDFIKLKLFCTTKVLVSKLKRSPKELEKTFASYTSDKGLIILLRWSSKTKLPKYQ
jgi:hypothetical protein